MHSKNDEYINIVENRALPQLFHLISGIFKGQYVLTESRKLNEYAEDGHMISHFHFDVKIKAPHSK